MKRYKTSAELKDIAKGRLRGNYGTCILTYLLPILIITTALIPLFFFLIMFTGLSQVLTGSPVNENVITACSYGITVVSTLFQYIFTAGTTLFYLNMACGRRFSISDIFFGFRWQFKKTLGISLFLLIPFLVCNLPYWVCYSIWESGRQFEWGIAALIAYLVDMAVYIPVSLMLSQAFYLLLDFPQYSVMQLIKLSCRVMKGHKGRLFYIGLSFIPLKLLAILSLGIGFLWVYPYQYMTQTLFFLDLMNPQEES